MTFRRVQRQGKSPMAVLCPRRMRVIDVVECRRCEHCRGLSLDPGGTDVFLRCAWQRTHGRHSLSTAARQESVATIMSAPATCVSESADLASVLSLLVGSRIGAAPVVNGSGRAVGIVTERDLVRWQDEHRAAAERCVDGPTAIEDGDRGSPNVRQVMSHVVFEVHAEADISRAAAVMAYEGVHHVVVTSLDGHALGVVSSLDIAGWLARACGYVVEVDRRQDED
jgi:CBS domain-containing protein